MSVYRIPLTGNSVAGDAVMFVTVEPSGFLAVQVARLEIATPKGIERAVLERHEVAAIVMRLQEVVDHMDRNLLEREETRRRLQGGA